MIMDIRTANELLSLVERNYKEIADRYNETRKKHLSPLWDRLVGLAGSVPDNARVLDVGCGNGRLLEAFGDKPVEYVGVDQSRRLLEHARIMRPKRRFEYGTVLDLAALRERPFDTVFAVAVIHHIPGTALRKRALEELRSVTKAGGTVVLTVWDLWRQKRFRRELISHGLWKLAGRSSLDWGDIVFPWKHPDGRPASDRYYHAFTAGSLRRLARSAGFTAIRVERDRANYYLIVRV
jgi:SAM-dependent methyltransferase